MNYRLISELHSSRGWSIKFMCEKLSISRAAYYKWLGSDISEKQAEDEKITARIKEIAESNNSLFGAMKMYYALREEGYACGHNRVYRLMCINDIRSTYRRKSAYRYSKSTPEQAAENLLSRNFDVEGPNQVWCTDVTEIKVPGTGEKLYISTMIDLYDRYPVAMVVSSRNDAALANRTLDDAHARYPDAKPMVHSDRGFAYTRKAYHDKLIGYGMSQSMSRISKCIDNGVCEGFQGQFKDMLFILHPDVGNKEEMMEAIEDTKDYYINHYPQRRLGGRTCGRARKEAMEAKIPPLYPIKKANRYIKYWDNIENKKKHSEEKTIMRG